MKATTIITIAPLLAASGSFAFVPSSSRQQKVATITSELHMEKNRREVVTAAALLVGIGSLSSQAAFAADIEEFALPSYDSSTGSRLVDISSELETVNKQTLTRAKAKREYKDNSAEKLEADALRNSEKEGSSLFDSMIGSAEADKKARLEAEKAEARANRWKTF